MIIIDPKDLQFSSPVPPAAPPSPAVPSGTLHRLLTASDTRSIFGGCLFQRTDDSGYPTVTFAVERSAAEPSYVTAAAGRYGATNRSALPFIRSKEPYEDGPFTLFDFELMEEESSLADWLRSESACPIDYNTLLCKLIQLLITYRDAQRNGYAPLCCISPETVFIDGRTGSLRLLPLLAAKGDYPVSIPREAGTQAACLKTDLYSAVFVSVYAFSARSKGGLLRPSVPILLDCLMPVPEWRPEPESVLNALGTSVQSGAPVFEKKPAAALEQLSRWSEKLKKRLPDFCFPVLEEPETPTQTGGTLNWRSGGEEE